MKGKKLNVQEVLNLEVGDKVYIEPISDMYEDEIGEATVILDQNEKCLLSSKKKNYSESWEIGGYKETDSEKWLTVYEWIKEQSIKTYKASELLHMIEENILKDDDIIICTNTTKEINIDDFKMSPIGEVLLAESFYIKQTPVDFVTACNSGKKIKPIRFKNENKYKPYTYWLGYLASNMDTNNGKVYRNPLHLINDKWLIEQNY